MVLRKHILHLNFLQLQHLLPPTLLDVLLIPLLLSSLGAHHHLGIRMGSSGATTLVSLNRTQGGNSVVLLWILKKASILSIHSTSTVLQSLQQQWHLVHLHHQSWSKQRKTVSILTVTGLTWASFRTLNTAVLNMQCPCNYVKNSNNKKNLLVTCFQLFPSNLL